MPRGGTRRLYVIGTNRHESRRVDLQLRGRAGRQGDPGESRFFVSLEDELLVRYGIHGLIPARLPGKVRRAHRESGGAAGSRARAAHHRGPELRDSAHAGALRRCGRRAASPGHRTAAGDAAGEEAPDVWEREPERRAALVAAAGESAVVLAERTITLGCIDRAWRDHLALCADLREGIHLVRLGGQDPLPRFTSDAIQSFSQFDDAVDGRCWKRCRR